MQFLLQAGVPDTPDLFGKPRRSPSGRPRPGCSRARARSSTASGDVLNGTLFISVPGDNNSARAITIFGTTALLRAWRWDGASGRNERARAAARDPKRGFSLLETMIAM